MDDGLVLNNVTFASYGRISLNPYCSGRWSRTRRTKLRKKSFDEVLILIVVDDGLVHLLKLI